MVTPEWAYWFPDILPKDTLPKDILPNGHSFGKVSFGKMSGHRLIKRSGPLLGGTNV